MSTPETPRPRGIYIHVESWPVTDFSGAYIKAQATASTSDEFCDWVLGEGTSRDSYAEAEARAAADALDKMHARSRP